MTDRRLPHSPEAEQWVIGSVLKSPAAMEALDELHPDHFFVPRYRSIFAKMRQLHAAGTPIGMDTLSAAGVDLLELTDVDVSVPTASRVEHYAQEVLAHAARRRAISRAAKVAEHAWRGRDWVTEAQAFASELPSNGHAAASAARRFQLITADELKKRPDPAWLVDMVLQRDTLGLLVGAQETLKTFTALDIALGVATGVGWQGHPVAEAGTAVYVSSEGGSGIGLRVTAWEIVHGVQVGDRCLFLCDQAPQFLDQGERGDIAELLASIGELGLPPDLVVVDTVARSMVGGDENSAQDMGLFVAAADRIRQATGAVVLVVHHTSKAGGARGSSALLGAVHTIIEASREANSRVVALRCGKQKDADHFPTLTLRATIVELGANPDTGVMRTSLVLERSDEQSSDRMAGPHLTPAAQRALDALLQLGETTFASWRDAAGLPLASFKRARGLLLTEGLIEHSADRYRPTPAAGLTRAQSGLIGPNGPWAHEGLTEGPPHPLKGVGPWPQAPAPQPGPDVEEALPWR